MAGSEEVVLKLAFLKITAANNTRTIVRKACILFQFCFANLMGSIDILKGSGNGKNGMVSASLFSDVSDCVRNGLALSGERQGHFSK